MYKILINESGVLKLVEVPEPEKKLWFRSEATPADNIAALKKLNSEALSAALADESKHIAFKDEENMVFARDLCYESQCPIPDKCSSLFCDCKLVIGQTFDLPPNIGVSFEYQLKDGGGWKDITHRHYLNSFPEHRRLLAILTPITEANSTNNDSNGEGLTATSCAPVKSEGEEPTQYPHREICGLCHRVSPVGFWVPNDVWDSVVHHSRINDIHCLSCFIERADEKLIDWSKEIKFYPVSLRSHIKSVTPSYI